MEVICQNCHTKLNIPDEKIPKDQMARVNCPRCKNKITLDPRKVAPEKPTDEEPPDRDETGKFHLKFIESQRSSEAGEKDYSYDDFRDEEAIDTFDEDARLALVMTSGGDDSESIKKALEELRYKHVSAPTTREATGKMRYNFFHLVILDDGFDGQELEQSPVLNFLNHLSISQRRRMFVVLISDKFKTGDDMMAYTMSANAVINRKDLERLAPVLKKGLSEYDRFYKVFFDTLADVGKT